jgi:hypothetical protein
MAQTLLDLDPHPADPRTGFELGWDHAHHGLVPPPEQWHEGNALRQGWQAGKTCFGARTLPVSRHVRRWLALRLHAWQRGRAFELGQVTPNYLRQIDTAHCPVTRVPLSHGSGLDSDASVDRVRDDAAYAAGNLVLMSARANRAKGAFDWHDALVLVQQAQASNSGSAHGLGAAEWTRLAVLMSFVTPLPHASAATLPLRVLPPNRLRLLNPVQGLQALLTRDCGKPAWSPRMRALADHLPDAASRHDFNLFVNALLPRLIEAARGNDALALRQAQEDAWCDALLNRRWQRFALRFDEAGIDALLQRCARLDGVRTLLHERALATDGWALETCGMVPATAPPQPALRPGSMPAGTRPMAPIAAPRRGALAALH